MVDMYIRGGKQTDVRVLSTNCLCSLNMCKLNTCLSWTMQLNQYSFVLQIVINISNYKKRCTRLAAASDKVYQLLSHGRWFPPGTLASSITTTGRHDIAEILLKVALSTIKSNELHTYITEHWAKIELINISLMAANPRRIGDRLVWVVG
jgi:hypothetical protein